MRILSLKCRIVLGGAENCISLECLGWGFRPPLESKLIENGDHGYQNSETCGQFTPIDLYCSIVSLILGTKQSLEFSSFLKLSDKK